MTDWFVHRRPRVVLCPVLLEPLDGAITDGEATLFVIASVEVDSVAIYIWKEGDPQPTEPTAEMEQGQGGEWFYTATDLDASASYHWYATATKDGVTSVGCSGGAFDFSTEEPPPPPDCPELDAPTDGATDVDGTSVDFSVTAADVDSVGLFLWPDGEEEPEEATAEMVEGPAGTWTATVTDLEPDTLYHWTAHATVGDLTSSGCGSFDFTTEADEEPPAIAGPLIWMEAWGDLLFVCPDNLVINVYDIADGGTLIQSENISNPGGTTCGIVHGNRLYVGGNRRFRTYAITGSGITLSLDSNSGAAAKPAETDQLVKTPDGTGCRLYYKRAIQGAGGGDYLSYVPVALNANADFANAQASLWVAVATSPALGHPVAGRLVGLSRDESLVGVYWNSGVAFGAGVFCVWGDDTDGSPAAGPFGSNGNNDIGLPIGGTFYDAPSPVNGTGVMSSRFRSRYFNLNANGSSPDSVVTVASSQVTDAHHKRYYGQRDGHKHYVVIPNLPSIAYVATDIGSVDSYSSSGLEPVTPYD